MTLRFKSHKSTLAAGFTGYIVQAIIVTFAPLLFVTFQSEFSITLSQLGVLVTVNFLVQIVVDLLGAQFVDKIGYRPCIVAAHIFVGAGLLGLAFFPYAFSDPYAGIVVSIVIYAIGGGLIEVLISPIIEGCPTKNKASMMSLLHSFYCWGVVLVVVVSTVFFVTAGLENWRYLAIIWAAIPFLNAIFFCFVPIFPLLNADGTGGKGLSIKKILSSKTIWLFFVFMICSGAAEQSVAQWSSLFAESGLKVSKTVGDLLGPCLFAVLMGITRVLYAKFSHRINLKKAIFFSSILCVFSYLLIIFSPIAALGLVGCGICGLSVGILWPGVFSIASADFPKGGTAMFALLSLSGDVGCSLGPYIAGAVSDAAGGEMKWGILASIIFPAALAILMGIYLKNSKKKAQIMLNADDLTEKVWNGEN